MNNVHVCRTRNRNESTMFSPVNFSITNYSTDAQSKAMKNALGDTLLFNNINNLHLIPDPLKKNLADSVITGTIEQRKESDKFEKPQPTSESGALGSLGGITNFFSGVFNVMTAMFQKRPSSPTTKYYDCFDAADDGQMTPSLAWHPAKFEVQNKTTNSDNMDNISVITNSEDNLTKVHLLLNGNVQNYSGPVYVDPRSIEESFEDAFCPESIVQLANDTLIECYSSYNQQHQELLEVEAPFIKTDFCKESMDIVKNVNEIETEKTDMDIHEKDVSMVNNSENQIVTTCEDKLNKLKELLQCKQKKYGQTVQDTTPIPIKEVISSSFGNEIISTEETKSSFDEVNGRFYSSSADSDDSFQIVFTDRKRMPSDCESEDSFIVFDDSPDCYTNNDVFGSDSESETEDSGYVMTCLNHSLSRTFGDLTDDSLYGTDVVDCAVQVGHAEVTEKTKLSDTSETKSLVEDKKQKPLKKVRFSTDPPKVHVMRVWAFAARQARAGHWERHALDRDRFRRRIADVEMAISWVLKPQHRTRVMFQRFMPWWNALKRKELADKHTLEKREVEDLGKEISSNREDIAVTEELDLNGNEDENAIDVKPNLSLTETDNTELEKSNSIENSANCDDNISFNNLSDKRQYQNQVDMDNRLDLKHCDIRQVENGNTSEIEKEQIEVKSKGVQDEMRHYTDSDGRTTYKSDIEGNIFQKRNVDLLQNMFKLQGLDLDNDT